MITMGARSRQADGQTDEHHGNNATIGSTNASDANKLMKNLVLVIDYTLVI